MQDDGASDADVMHSFEVSSNALSRDIAVEPDPIDPGPGGLSSIEESWRGSHLTFGAARKTRVQGENDSGIERGVEKFTPGELFGIVQRDSPSLSVWRRLNKTLL